MKRKALSTLLVLIITIGTLGIFTIPPAYAQPVVKIVETVTGSSTISWSEPTNAINDTFTVDVIVEGVTDLLSWAVGLSWDPAVLECVAADYYSEFKDAIVAAGGDTVRVAGSIGVGSFTTPWGESSTGPTVSGTFKLIWATFKAIDYSLTASVINFTVDTEIRDSVGAITFTPQTASFTFLPTINMAPTASFTMPAPPYYAPVELTFDASGSTDPDGTIVSYEWTLANSTAVVATFTGVVVTYNFTVADDYTMTLNVTDNGKPPYTGDYAPKSDILTTPFTVYEKVESYLDVWTYMTDTYRVGTEAGKGPDAYGSAFAPSYTVTLKTEFYYNGVPVPGYSVSIQVNDPNDNPFVAQSVNTDANGQANITFNLPPSPTFGIYTAVATATIFGESFNDTVTFYVGWIVELVSVTAPGSVDRGTSGTFTLTIKNYALESLPVLSTIEARDLNNVPVGVASTSFNIAGASAVGLGVTAYSTDIPISLTIPTWAWPGPAMVYANAYDKWPHLGGVVWSPQVSASFSIT